jgi:hypothetical protein
LKQPHENIGEILEDRGTGNYLLTRTLTTQAIRANKSKNEIASNYKTSIKGNN